MTAYQALRNAVSRQGGVTTPYAIRDVLTAYLASLRQPRTPLGEGTLCVFDTRGRMRMMTRAEYTEMVHARKRKPRRKRGESDPVLYAYDSIEDKRIEARLHSPGLDAEFAAYFEWLDQLAAKHRKELDEDGYHGEF